MSEFKEHKLGDFVLPLNLLKVAMMLAQGIPINENPMGILKKYIDKIRKDEDGQMYWHEFDRGNCLSVTKIAGTIIFTLIIASDIENTKPVPETPITIKLKEFRTEYNITNNTWGEGINELLSKLNELLS
jgi:hypothetical protein